MNPQTLNPNAQSFGHSQKGFTLIELLVGVLTTVMLTTVVVVNFTSLRRSQELSGGISDFVSKVREVQNFTLSGYRLPSGQTADAYEITLTAGNTNYRIDYDIAGVKTVLETVNLSQNVQTNQILVGGTPTSPTVIRIAAPFGKISVAGSASQTAEVRLMHTLSSQTQSILIDPISGRIGKQ